MLRALSFELRGIAEGDLPLTKPENVVKENDKLDLSKKNGFAGRNSFD